MKRLTQVLMSLAVAGLILYALLRHFDIQQTIASIRTAQPQMLVLGFALMMFSYLLRGARWPIWERSLTFWDSLRVILIGFMGNNILPARLGEILRAHCAAAKTSDDHGRTAILASITAERLLDGLILAFSSLVGLALVPVDRRLQWVLLVVSAAFAALTSGLILGIKFHERIRSFVAVVNHRFPGHMTAFAMEKSTYFLEGLLPLGMTSRMITAIGATVIIWSVELGSYYFIGVAVWNDMNLRTALLFLVVVNFASLVPFTMGGIGTIEAAATAFLISSGVPRYLALAMVLLQHAGQYFFTTIAGGLLYLTGGFYRIPLTQPKAFAAPIRRPSEPAPSCVVEEARSDLRRLSTAAQLNRHLSARSCSRSLSRRTTSRPACLAPYLRQFFGAQRTMSTLN